MADASHGSATAEDPLAADKRTMVIGGVAMVALILVGVVSAQLFARGGCATLPEPRPVEVADVGTPEDVLADRFGADAGAALLAAVGSVAGASVEAAVPVGDASRVAALDGGLVTTGAQVTSFDASLDPVETYTSTSQVVGDGATVYDVTIPNELTGQTDALVPLSGPELTVGTCVDTAVVGSNFAFLLDAGAAELLLLRADEEGGSAELELRDAEQGSIWDAQLQLPAGPPGTLAERLTAELGPDTVVAARRVGPQEETDTPAAVAVSRDDGTERFTLTHDTLLTAAQLEEGEPIRWQVAAVSDRSALLYGRPDRADVAADAPPTADGSLVLVDLDDGSAITAVTGIGPVTAAAAASGVDDRYAIATRAAEGRNDEVLLLGGEGELASAELAPVDTSFAWERDALLVASRDGLARVPSDGSDPLTADVAGVTVRSVTTTADDRLAVLAAPAGTTSGDEDGATDAEHAVLLITGPVGDPAPTSDTADDG